MMNILELLTLSDLELETEFGTINLGELIPHENVTLAGKEIRHEKLVTSWNPLGFEYCETNEDNDEFI